MHLNHEVIYKRLVRNSNGRDIRSTWRLFASIMTIQYFFVQLSLENERNYQVTVT